MIAGVILLAFTTCREALARGASNDGIDLTWPLPPRVKLAEASSGRLEERFSRQVGHIATKHLTGGQVEQVGRGVHWVVLNSSHNVESGLLKP